MAWNDAIGRPNANRPERVLLGHVQRRLRAAYLFEREQHRRAVEQLFGLRPALALFAEQFARRIAEADRCVRAGRVERRHDLALHAAAVEVDDVHRRVFLVFLGEHDREVGDVAVGHRHFRTFDGAFLGPGLEAARRFACTFGDRKRADPFTGGELRQITRLLLGAAEGEQRLGREIDARRERCGREAATQLFGEHAQFEVTEPDAAELFRDRRRGPAEVDHAAPQLRIVRLIAVEHATDGRQRTLVGKEGLGLFAQQVLLVGELEIHARFLWAGGGRAGRKGG